MSRELEQATLRASTWLPQLSTCCQLSCRRCCLADDVVLQTTRQYAKWVSPANTLHGTTVKGHDTFCC